VAKVPAWKAEVRGNPAEVRVLCSPHGKALYPNLVEDPDSNPGQCGFDPHGRHAIRQLTFRSACLWAAPIENKVVSPTNLAQRDAVESWHEW
jgi:hypothetical protein